MTCIGRASSVAAENKACGNTHYHSLLCVTLLACGCGVVLRTFLNHWVALKGWLDRQIC